MDEKVARIQQRLRAQLSQPVVSAASVAQRHVIGFEVVSGIPTGAENLVPEVVAELKGRGHRVARVMRYGCNTVPPAYQADPSQACYRADANLVVTPERCVLTSEHAAEPSLPELLDRLGEGYDVVIVEGFEYAPVPKVLVTRKVQEGFNLGLPNIVAYVACKDAGALIPLFSPLDVGGIASMIERDIMGVEPAAHAAHAETIEGCAEVGGGTDGATVPDVPIVSACDDGAVLA